jgi:hypothetical protein
MSRVTWASPDLDALALELTGDALGTVRGMGRVDLDDALRQLTTVELSPGPASVRPDPAVVVAGVGRQNPAHPIHAEPAAASVNEGEASAGRGVVDQRFRSLAQDLILDAETLDLTSLPAKFIAQPRDHDLKVTTTRANSRHDHKACQKPTTHRAPWPTRATIMTTPTRLHINRLNLRAGAENRADSTEPKAHLQHILTAIAVNIERLSFRSDTEETPSETTDRPSDLPGPAGDPPIEVLANPRHLTPTTKIPDRARLRRRLLGLAGSPGAATGTLRRAGRMGLSKRVSSAPFPLLPLPRHGLATRQTSMLRR